MRDQEFMRRHDILVAHVQWLETRETLNAKARAELYAALRVIFLIPGFKAYFTHLMNKELARITREIKQDREDKISAGRLEEQVAYLESFKVYREEEERRAKQNDLISRIVKGGVATPQESKIKVLV